MDSVCLSGRDRGFVARIGVSSDADSGIVGQHALEANAHLGSSVSHNYLSGVK